MQLIGRYELAGEIGRGASGVVYRAIDPAIGRTVALKTIRLDNLADAAERDLVRERLFREARSAGALLHPNIVTIFDVGEEENLAYLAMEFVEGAPLNERELEPDALLRILQQTGAALDFAHAKGIIHRDIKPANILIDLDGQPKILDFGIAKVASQQMTQSGILVGTPNYMSPEQIEGTLLDGRSDQFSLAVIAYELLTGERPFRGDSLPALLYQITQQNPQPAHLINPSLPTEATNALHRALSKHPISRYRTCAAFATDLTESLEATHNWKPLARGEAGDLPTLATTRATGTWPTQPATIHPPGAIILEPPPAAPPTPPPAASVMHETILPEVRTPVRLDEQPLGHGRQWAAIIGIPAVIVAGLLGYWAFLNRPSSTDSTDIVSASDDGSRPSPMPGATVAPAPVSNPPADTTAEQQATATPTETTAPSRPANGNTSAATNAATNTLPNFDSSEPELVQIISHPNGAKVTIDNGDRTCTSPCSVLLNPGTHSVAFALDTYRSITRRMEVPREKSMDIVIERATGTLMLRSMPAGATITMDGQPMSQKTPAVLTLPIGKHRFRLTAEGKQPYEESVEIKDQVISTLNIDW